MLANPILCEFDMDLLMAEFVWSLQQDTFILFSAQSILLPYFKVDWGGGGKAGETKPNQIRKTKNLLKSIPLKSIK